MQPFRSPIGLQLSQTARTVSRAFNEALEQAGGTLPVWLILLNLKIHRPERQRALAEAVGVRDATLTHHLNAMEKSGLITRRRDADNRRIHVVGLTAAGEEAFLRLRHAAVAFDARLNSGLSETDAGALSELLARLAANVGGTQDGVPPWAGLADNPTSRPAMEHARRGGEAVVAGDPGDQLQWAERSSAPGERSHGGRAQRGQVQEPDAAEVAVPTDGQAPAPLPGSSDSGR